MRSIIAVLKNQSVLCISFAAAVISMFFVPPSKNYGTYINWNTIAILYALMLIIAGFEKCGVFMSIGNAFCNRVHSTRTLAYGLISLNFFSSMFITNDVSLLAFIPFTLSFFENKKLFSKKTALYIVVLQTIAANTGSMFTPVGNPQNLFLYAQTGLKVTTFMHVMLPYTLLSALFLIGAASLIPSQPVKMAEVQFQKENKMKYKKIHIILYCILFCCALLSVFRVIQKPLLLVIVFCTVLLIDKTILLSVDYALLFTFICFFIFTGNIGAMPELRFKIETLIHHNEYAFAVGFSQIISNVPATLLLYPFVKNVKELLLGVNIGGLGTLVASLASLISYTLFTRRVGARGLYLVVFTFLNCLLLAILCIFHFFLK